MKKIFAAMLAVLCAMTLLEACTANAPQGGEGESPANSSGHVQDEKAPNQAEAKDDINLLFTCTILEDAAAKAHQEAGFYFSDCGGDEPAVNVSISANDDLQAFKIVELEFEENNGEASYHRKNTLFTLDSLPANTDFVLRTVLIGTFPHRGISFSDANHVEHIYALVTSGEDGSVFLQEIAAQ